MKNLRSPMVKNQHRIGVEIFDSKRSFHPGNCPITRENYGGNSTPFQLVSLTHRRTPHRCTSPKVSLNGHLLASLIKTLVHLWPYPRRACRLDWCHFSCLLYKHVPLRPEKLVVLPKASHATQPRRRQPARVR